VNRRAADCGICAQGPLGRGERDMVGCHVGVPEK